MSNKPEVDYTLQIHKRDHFGSFYITSPEVPGLILWGRDLILLLSDVPRAVNVLRTLNQPKQV